MDFVTISSGDLTARINPLGAELWSLTDSFGREYMTDADPAFWTGHAPLLFPIVGALNGDTYRLDGEEYGLPRHGFARKSVFEVLEAGTDRALFRLTDSPETRAVYPFAFMLEMAFRLEGTALFTEARVINSGDASLPFSLGFHPGFAWPLPGGATKADHVVAFEQPEPQPIRRIDGPTGLLLPEPVASPVEGHILPLDAALFEEDAVIWDRLSSRALTYGAPGGTQLAIAFPDTPMLGIWQKPGAAYLCIEPWQGHADPLGFAGDFREKPGVITLAPGEARSFRMDVAVLSAD
ncbi:aldose 1-epimerase family protein [Novosphingobium resinovorum]|uniref:aldose 1-epimerase family protein n=1 Tax=Novosphingobium TaxID=165696 RepID=UPI001B3C528B|nr:MULTISPECIES: aldose 1-epimerase family protein [Novosphingobium]MBF7010068.1 aldose 1-epimerase family protein [Novosphingobium sp. HR1a]WJM28088.1 aldose 1-epimerase family protein [Novosphingobium resinovorum]